MHPHGLQHARLPCPSPTPRVYSNSCHWVGGAFQPSHPLLSPSPAAFNLSQHKSIFKWVSSLHQVAKVIYPFNGYISMAFKHIHSYNIITTIRLQHFHHPQKKLYPSAITLHSLSRCCWLPLSVSIDLPIPEISQTHVHWVSDAI